MEYKIFTLPHSVGFSLCISKLLFLYYYIIYSLCIYVYIGFHNRYYYDLKLLQSWTLSGWLVFPDFRSLHCELFQGQSVTENLGLYTLRGFVRNLPSHWLVQFLWRILRWRPWLYLFTFPCKAGYWIILVFAEAVSTFLIDVDRRSLMISMAFLIARC